MGQIPPVNPNAAAQFDPCSDPFTTSLIRKKVARLIRLPPFSVADSDDLYQELLSAVVKSAGNIDAEIGHRNPYITTVVERQMYTIRQRHQAIKRDPTNVASLNVLLQLSEPLTCIQFAQRLGQGELDAGEVSEYRESLIGSEKSETNICQISQGR